MRRVCACLLLLAAVAAARPPGSYVTELGRRVLVLCDMVTTGEITAVHKPFRGVSTARLTTGEHLSGLERRGELTLMYIEDFLAPDAIRATFESGTVSFAPTRSTKAKRILENEEAATGNQPETTRTRETVENAPDSRSTGSGVRLIKGEKGIFFLRRKGASFAIIGLIPDRDPLYERKRKRLDDMLALEAIESPDARLRAAKAYFLRSLRSEDVWQRGNAAREIESLAQRHAAAFTKTERQFLAERLYVEEKPAIAASLERAVRSIAPEEALAYAFEAELREREAAAKALERENELIRADRVPEMRAADLVGLANRYGRAATEVLCGYLTDEEPVVRESVAGILSRHGGPSCRPALRTALQTERDADAARAMIHTLGVKSDPQAVPLIRPWLKRSATERAAIQALGRIGTDDAWAALRAHEPAASSTGRATIRSLLRERPKAR